MRPLGEDDVVHCLFLLRDSVEVVVDVDEHLGEGVYLGDELAEVSGGGSGVVPGPLVAVEDSICAVESAALEGHGSDAVGSDANEEVEDDGRGGVMRAEVVFVEELLFVVAAVLLYEVFDPLVVAL